LLEPAPVPATKAPSAGEKLPNAPTGVAKSKQKTQEELELEALQQELAI
jgi:charged multivesicular body protein 4/18S rRNA (guanine1575-N7)-methyltransferase